MGTIRPPPPPRAAAHAAYTPPPPPQTITAGTAGTNPMKGNPEAIAAVAGGAVVYHRRSKAILAALAVMIGFTFVAAPSAAYAAALLAIMFVYVDFYGAVLHVVLDHPAFVTMPIIGDGCLEFQWHHAIPCVCG